MATPRTSRDDFDLEEELTGTDTRHNMTGDFRDDPHTSGSDFTIVVKCRTGGGGGSGSGGAPVRKLKRSSTRAGMGTGGACTTSRAAAASASSGSGSGSGSGGGGAGGGAGAGGGSSSGGDGGDAGSGSASSKPPRVKKQEWFVHRHYICNGPRACPYFAQQIRGSSNLHRDAKEGRVEISLPEQQAAVFDMVLEYMYHDSLRRWELPANDDLVALFTLARVLRMDNLQKELQARFKDTFGSSTALKYLIDAVALGGRETLPKWVAACVKMTAKHYGRWTEETNEDGEPILNELPFSELKAVLSSSALRATPAQISSSITLYIRAREVEEEGGTWSWTLSNKELRWLLEAVGSAVLPEDALYLLGVSLATASAAAGATAGDSKDSEGDGDGAEPTEFQQAAIATVAESFGQLRVEDIGYLPAPEVIALCSLDQIGCTDEEYVFRTVQAYVRVKEATLEKDTIRDLWSTVRFGALEPEVMLEAMLIESVPRDVMCVDLVAVLVGSEALGSKELRLCPRLEVEPRTYLAAGDLA